MTKEKAIRMALKIIEICHTYGVDNRCNQCPFNIKGACMLSDGNAIPSDWELSNIMNEWVNIDQILNKKYGEE